jgi:hypothetical protein
MIIMFRYIHIFGHKKHWTTRLSVILPEINTVVFWVLIKSIFLIEKL